MSSNSQTPARTNRARPAKPEKQAATFAAEIVDVRVTVERFRAFESGSPSTATLELVNASNVVTLQEVPGSYYVIRIAPWNPETEAQEVILRFLMDRTDYLLLGIAFSNSRFSSTPKTTRLGQDQFPTIE